MKTTSNLVGLSSDRKTTSSSVVSVERQSLAFARDCTRPSQARPSLPLASSSRLVAGSAASIWLRAVLVAFSLSSSSALHALPLPPPTFRSPPIHEPDRLEFTEEVIVTPGSSATPVPDELTCLQVLERSLTNLWQDEVYQYEQTTTAPSVSPSLLLLPPPGGRGAGSDSGEHVANDEDNDRRCVCMSYTYTHSIGTVKNESLFPSHTALSPLLDYYNSIVEGGDGDKNNSCKDGNPLATFADDVKREMNHSRFRNAVHKVRLHLSHSYSVVDGVIAQHDGTVATVKIRNVEMLTLGTNNAGLPVWNFFDWTIGSIAVNDDNRNTTLMTSIANNQVEGFPDSNDVRTVFVAAGIQGEQSHLSCIEYIFVDPMIQALGCTCDQVREMLANVGFMPDGKAKPDHSVSTLLGGWRMKLALACAMLQKADILLLDELPNHLDVINVAWVKKYLNSLTNVTAIIVSHDSGLLNDCCTNILQIENLTLHSYKGNLDEFVKIKPSARAYFSFTKSKLKFRFPQPDPIEGVKSKGKALMKMSKCTFTYPGNEKPTRYDISVQVLLSSRVTCVWENGVGKPTMIKLLVGEIKPQMGDVWKHPKMIADVSDLSRFHEGAYLKMKFRFTLLCDVGLEAIQRIQFPALRYSGRDDGIPESLTLIFSHSLENAVHEVNTGGQVTLQVTSRESNTLFEMIDNGKGLPSGMCLDQRSGINDIAAAPNHYFSIGRMGEALSSNDPNEIHKVHAQMEEKLRNLPLNGVGEGLPLSYHLIRSLGGDLRHDFLYAETGSHIWFALPAQKDNDIGNMLITEAIFKKDVHPPSVITTKQPQRAAGIKRKHVDDPAFSHFSSDGYTASEDEGTSATDQVVSLAAIQAVPSFFSASIVEPTPATDYVASLPTVQVAPQQPISASSYKVTQAPTTSLQLVLHLLPSHHVSGGRHIFVVVMITSLCRHIDGVASTGNTIHAYKDIDLSSLPYRTTVNITSDVPVPVDRYKDIAYFLAGQQPHLSFMVKVLVTSNYDTSKPTVIPNMAYKNGPITVAFEDVSTVKANGMEFLEPSPYKVFWTWAIGFCGFFTRSTSGSPPAMITTIATTEPTSSSGSTSALAEIFTTMTSTVAGAAGTECQVSSMANPALDCAIEGQFSQLRTRECNNTSGIHYGAYVAIPQACTFEYNPVCGCNGLGYGNACAAHGNGLHISRLGQYTNSNTTSVIKEASSTGATATVASNATTASNTGTTTESSGVKDFPTDSPTSNSSTIARTIPHCDEAHGTSSNSAFRHSRSISVRIVPALISIIVDSALLPGNGASSQYLWGLSKLAVAAVADDCSTVHPDLINDCIFIEQMVGLWLGHSWCLLSSSRTSIILVALFGVVFTVDFARPPLGPPTNTVDHLVDRPLLHTTTILRHQFHGQAFTATVPGLPIGAGLCHGGDHPAPIPILSLDYGLSCLNIDLSLSLEYGWSSGGDLLTADLSIFLGAGLLYGSSTADLSLVLGHFGAALERMTCLHLIHTYCLVSATNVATNQHSNNTAKDNEGAIMWTSLLLDPETATMLILWTILLVELSWSVPYYATHSRCGKWINRVLPKCCEIFDRIHCSLFDPLFPKCNEWIKLQCTIDHLLEFVAMTHCFLFASVDGIWPGGVLARVLAFDPPLLPTEAEYMVSIWNILPLWRLLRLPECSSWMILSEDFGDTSLTRLIEAVKSLGFTNSIESIVPIAIVGLVLQKGYTCFVSWTSQGVESYVSDQSLPTWSGCIDTALSKVCFIDRTWSRANGGWTDIEVSIENITDRLISVCNGRTDWRVMSLICSTRFDKCSVWIDWVLLRCSKWLTQGVDVSDLSLPKCNEWTTVILDVVLPMCNKGIDWFDRILVVRDCALPKCNAWITLIVDCVKLVLLKSNYVLPKCDKWIFTRITWGSYVFPVLCLFA